MAKSVHTTLYKRIDDVIKIDSIVFPQRIRLANAFGPPVLVWTMTKVGTTSIARSLQAKIGKYRVFGEHNLNDPDWPRSVVLYRELISKQKPVKILTAVRDPIRQAVSNFFHRYEFYTGDCATSPHLSVDEAVSAFVQTDIDISWENWFDDNLKRYLGLDIYDHPFPMDSNYLNIKHDNFDILLLKAETDNLSKARVIADFLDLSSFKIKDCNVGDAQPYGSFYKAFKRYARLPPSYLNHVKRSRYINHFYSPSEIRTILSRWTG